jgi:hypothetical protein
MARTRVQMRLPVVKPFMVAPLTFPALCSHRTREVHNAVLPIPCGTIFLEIFAFSYGVYQTLSEVVLIDYGDFSLGLALAFPIPKGDLSSSPRLPASRRALTKEGMATLGIIAQWFNPERVVAPACQTCRTIERLPQPFQG